VIPHKAAVSAGLRRFFGHVRDNGSVLSGAPSGKLNRIAIKLFLSKEPSFTSPDTRG
jgi:hypothetical protein